MPFQGQSGTKKLLPKRPKNSFTKPFEKPFSLQLEVKENLGSTRKLGDYGVYKASRRNFEQVESSEDEIIKAAKEYSFNKVWNAMHLVVEVAWIYFRKVASQY